MTRRFRSHDKRCRFWQAAYEYNIRRVRFEEVGFTGFFAANRNAAPYRREIRKIISEEKRNRK
jgi:hypothetical protein